MTIFKSYKSALDNKQNEKGEKLLQLVEKFTSIQIWSGILITLEVLKG